MTLYISDTDAVWKRAAKTALVYLIVSLFCGVFGAVYEVFSHEVYSFYMLYAFGFPLVGGTLPFLVLVLYPHLPYPNAVSRNLYHSGIATCTVGSIMLGVLEIYGTTNRLTEFYWPVGIVLMLFGVVLYIGQLMKRTGNQNKIPELPLHRDTPDDKPNRPPSYRR